MSILINKVETDQRKRSLTFLRKLTEELNKLRYILKTLEINTNTNIYELTQELQKKNMKLI